MPTTDTDVSRLILTHPDLGHDPGTTLHTKVRTAWTKIGDNMNARFFTVDDLADSASQDFEHNFKCDFAELSYILYLRDTGTGELTRINNASSPPITDFDIDETSGDETTQITVTNNSGAERDLALVVLHDGGGSGSVGSGLSFEWTKVPGSEPVEDLENGAAVYKFSDSFDQKISAVVQMPEGFVSGTILRLQLSFYSPSSDSSYWRFRSTTTHIRDGVDAVSSTANQLSTNSPEVQSTSADLLQVLEFAITDTLGGVGSPLVSEKDTLIIEIERVDAASSPDDTADVRMLKSARHLRFE